MRAVDVTSVGLRSLQMAIVAPLFVALMAMLVDYASLRRFLCHAPAVQVSWMVGDIMLTGFAVGVAFELLGLVVGLRADGEPRSAGSAAGGVTSDPNAAWFSRQGSDGRDLALREVTTAPALPHADAHWEIEDLLTDLRAASGGSDLLDRRILTALGLSPLSLKPTQSIEDAGQLLSFRFGGLKSTYAWNYRVSALLSGYKAYVAVRNNGAPWQRCVTGEGISPALAVSIAALTRETWMYTT